MIVELNDFITANNNIIVSCVFMIMELNDIITANNNVLYLMSHDAVIMILSQLIITIELTINQTVPPLYR